MQQASLFHLAEPKLKARGLFDLAFAKRAGVSQSTLSRWVKEGRILRLGQGIYLHPKAPIPVEERDFAVACARFGKRSTIAGLTALYYYRLIEQVPSQVWVMVPSGRKTVDRRYRCLRASNFPMRGIEDHSHFRITSLERTLVDGFRYSTKLGLRTVISATLQAIRERKTTSEKLLRLARELKCEKFVLKHWEQLQGALAA